MRPLLAAECQLIATAIAITARDLLDAVEREDSTFTTEEAGQLLGALQRADAQIVQAIVAIDARRAPSTGGPQHQRPSM